MIFLGNILLNPDLHVQYWLKTFYSLNTFKCIPCKDLKKAACLHIYFWSKGVRSLTVEIGPIFGRKLKVCFTFFLWSTFEKQVLNYMTVHLFFHCLFFYCKSECRKHLPWPILTVFVQVQHYVWAQVSTIFKITHVL